MDAGADRLRDSDAGAALRLLAGTKAVFAPGTEPMKSPVPE
jgi:hypothetical protein